MRHLLPTPVSTPLVKPKSPSERSSRLNGLALDTRSARQPAGAGTQPHPHILLSLSLVRHPHPCLHPPPSDLINVEREVFLGAEDAFVGVVSVARLVLVIHRILRRCASYYVQLYTHPHTNTHKHTHRRAHTRKEREGETYTVSSHTPVDSSTRAGRLFLARRQVRLLDTRMSSQVSPRRRAPGFERHLGTESDLLEEWAFHNHKHRTMPFIDV